MNLKKTDLRKMSEGECLYTLTQNGFCVRITAHHNILTAAAYKRSKEDSEKEKYVTSVCGSVWDVWDSSFGYATLMRGLLQAVLEEVK